MKKLSHKLAGLLAACALVALVACAAGTQMASAEMPGAEGKAVIDYITKTNPYQSWDMWPGKDKLYKGQHPHGAFLTTYVTKGALEALNSKAGQVPYGEFIVKENYSPEKKLAAITVMYKLQGYNPVAGDWYWLKYQPDGTIEKEGMVGGCIGCHGTVKANDWLFTGPIK